MGIMSIIRKYRNNAWPTYLLLNATLINGGTSACDFLSGALFRMSNLSSRWRCVISRNGVVRYPADTNPAAPPRNVHVGKYSRVYN